MDMAGKLDLHKVILRQWSHDLSLPELAVCLFIADRTSGWNVERCRITIDEFEHGEPPYRMRIAASKRTILRAVDRLIRDGYITRSGRRGVLHGFSYALNKDRIVWMDETPDEENEESGVVDLPRRRRDKKSPVVPTSTHRRCQRDPTGGANEHPHITITSNDNTQHQHSLRAEVASLSEAEAEAGAKTDEAVKRKAAKTGTAGALFVLWRSAHLEAFPDAAVAPWPRYVVAQVKQFASLLIDPVSLLDFAVANWTKVVRDEFGWMTKNPPPRSPDIGFLMRHASGFTEAMNNHHNDNVEGVGEMDPRERLRQLGISEAVINKMKMPRGGAS